jgi:hypothetical protein
LRQNIDTSKEAGGGMAKVTDPNGVRWSVDRASMRHFWWEGGRTVDSETFDLVVRAVIWPFWFIGHWLGVRWVIVIERDGIQVGEERVSGLDKSQRRIQEIVESVGAGTWRASDMTG